MREIGRIKNTAPRRAVPSGNSDSNIGFCATASRHLDEPEIARRLRQNFVFLTQRFEKLQPFLFSRAETKTKTAFIIKLAKGRIEFALCRDHTVKPRKICVTASP